MENTENFFIINKDLEVLQFLIDECFRIVSIHADDLENNSIEIGIKIDYLEDLYFLKNAIMSDGEPLFTKKEIEQLFIEYISKCYTIDTKYAKLIYTTASKNEKMCHEIELLASFTKILNLENAKTKEKIL